MGIILNKPLILDRVKQHYNLKSNADLARFLGVAPNTITNWYGRKTFDLDILYTKCVGVDFNWLLTGEGSMLRDSQASAESQPVISPAEESLIYKMYKEEKAENKALIEEIGGLKERIRQLESQGKEPDHHTRISETLEAFTSESFGDYGEDSLPTKQPTTSKRSSAGKM